MDLFLLLAKQFDITITSIKRWIDNQKIYPGKQSNLNGTNDKQNSERNY